MTLNPVQVLRPDGTLAPGEEIDIARLRQRYAALVEARAYDTKASALQRQGRLATYPPLRGQEAAQIGAVAPLEPDDWLVASYRDAAAMHYRGYPWRDLLLTRMGDERGGHPPAGVNVLPPSITVGGHMIHAVGIAWAEVLQDRDGVVVTTFGDGATSEGDFHEAMNFAGVYLAPVVFVCENNGWAISMPFERQTAAESIADRAVGYGMPGVRVDGNDVVAVERVVAAAVDRARSGEGSTLIEALTFRMTGHTTADDAGRYRDESAVESWTERDPLERVRHHLADRGEWTPQWQAELEEASSAAIEAEVAAAEAEPAFDAGEIFDAMFAELPPALADQRRRAVEESA